MKIILVTIVTIGGIILISIMAFKQWSYNKMTNALLSGSVAQIQVNPSDLNDYLILDTRDKEEFEVSHLIGAHHMDPETKTFDVELLESKKPILVYCSVGLRSEKIGERIQSSNPNIKVYNLKGGFFQWVNDDMPIIDSEGKHTKKVHTYNKAWGIWVVKGDKTN